MIKPTPAAPSNIHMNPKVIVAFVVFSLLTPAALLLAGGDLRWTMAWAYAAIYLASVVLSRLLALKKTPGLLAERSNFTQAADTPAWDRALVPVVALIGPFAMIVTAGLDHRFGWGPGINPALQVVFLAIVAISALVAVWAMLANAFFSAVVHIQRERGHQVISRGPYAAVRHPAYAASVISSLATPLALGAVWALVPALIIIIGLVIRTALEDQMLQKELPGYTEYAAHVKYRLLPGVW